jgi:N-acetylmuramoyl-L-alanine amidase
MYVFFVVHKKFAGNKYCWFKSKVVQKADNTPVSGVPVTLKVLRDNLEKAGVAVNRRVTLVSNSEGYLSRDDTRTVIGVVTKWPLIANAFWGSFVSQEYLNRGNLYRFKREDVDNLAPVEPPLDIRLIKKADADMAGKRVLVDPGHGVAYALTSDRRSQEWFVVHQIGRRVIDILTREFNCHAANILFTRSAGFGLIEPDLKLKFRGADKAADAGDKRFEFKRKERLIRAKLNTVTLKEISDLLLTTHDDDNKPQDIAASDRIRLLTKNQKDDDTGAIDKIEDRLNTKLKKTGLCVQEDSVRWDDDEQQYVYTEERIAPKKGQDKIARLMAPLPISISDWFLIDDDMLRVLYARSARWSLAHEIGSGPTEGAGGTDCKEWIPYVREVMKSAGAVSYMETACAAELDIDTAIGPASSRAWSPTYRRNYFNKQACDLYISIHLNAAFNAKKPQQYTGKAKGCACEVVKPADQDQTRLSKVFIKYLDPYDHGLRQGGIPVPDKAVGLLNPDENDRIGQYVFLEIEFMDSLIPPDLQEFRYQEMVSGLFVEAVAQQIVSGIVEYFFDQAGLVQMDDVIYDGKLGVW